jgi:hypothetical protein
VAKFAFLVEGEPHVRRKSMGKYPPNNIDSDESKDSDDEHEHYKRKTKNKSKKMNIDPIEEGV